MMQPGKKHMKKRTKASGWSLRMSKNMKRRLL
jgi:hypothetical protein